MTTQQDERAKQIETLRKWHLCEADHYDAGDRASKQRAAQHRAWAALLQADAEVGGEAVGFIDPVVLRLYGRGSILSKEVVESSTIQHLANNNTPVYLRPQQAARVPLTDEQAPANSLPDWTECQLRVENSTFIEKRVAEGGYGLEDDSKTANELHRFIYEYDDADPYRSAWFLHRLEKLIEWARSTKTPPPGHILCLTCDGKGYQPIVDEP